MGSLIYMTMQKPFNPILGETYQSWIDGCPVYFEQISHHPPIAAYLMIGRGYKLSGTLEAKMDISINSGTGGNEGIFTVEFDNGRKFHYTTAPGELSGLTYGERKLLLVGKCNLFFIHSLLLVSWIRIISRINLQSFSQKPKIFWWLKYYCDGRCTIS